MNTMICSCGKICMNVTDIKNPNFCQCEAYYLCDEPKTKWINTSDRLPEEGQEVLVCFLDERGDGAYARHSVFMVIYEPHGEEESWPFHYKEGDGYGDLFFDAKYWMPLPEVPKE